MARPRLQYPVSPEVIDALREHPNIAKAISKDVETEKSELEIIRVLGNLHYGHLRDLARAIEKLAATSGPIGHNLLKSKDRLQFYQGLGEFRLFEHLYGEMGEAVSPVRLDPATPGNDIDVTLADRLIKIEVYTPTDFYGYQLFSQYVDGILKYLDVPRGFTLDCELKNNSGDLFFAYSFDGTESEAWLNEFVEDITRWLPTARPGSVYRKTLRSPDSELCVRVSELHQTYREIRVNFPTQSTDTRLFFEIGGAIDTAHSEWGKKLRRKLAKRQCGSASDSVVRLLVVNFSLANTGSPDFICQARFARRFEEAVRCIVGPEEPCDAVLPANLGLTRHIGTPCVLNRSVASSLTDFIERAHLWQTCGQARQAT